MSSGWRSRACCLDSYLSMAFYLAPNVVEVFVCRLHGEIPVRQAQSAETSSEGAGPAAEIR